MKRWTRWLILLSVTSAALALTGALMAAASPAPRLPLRSASGTHVPWRAPWPCRATAGVPGIASPLATLEPDLAKALATAAPDARLNVIVEMREQVAPAALVAGQESDPATARRGMVSALRATAARSQPGIRAYLATRWLAGDVERVTPFWIFNGLAVNGARADVVRALAARPDVALVRLDHWRRWIEGGLGIGDWGLGIGDWGLDIGDWGFGGSDAQHATRNTQHAMQWPTAGSATRNTQYPWGIERVRADEVWNTLGISGTGVVVANMDTGVDWLHPALQASYRGYSPKGFHQHAGNWYDATGEGALYPVDGHGHGSHTMGTLVGQGGIGVAPGARWIAVRAFNSEGLGLDSWIHAAFEWLLAPDGDPDLAPQVVNNSWGNDVGGLRTFQRDVDALRAAGIFLVFAAGNSGPGRGTVGSPASLPGAFAVGAADQEDEVAGFSSRGPSPWGEVRPHVVAPGVNVYSTMPGGAYRKWQGTSMATPHVAGTVALMLSARPGATLTRTAFVLTSTAVPLSDSIPNNESGYGRVDAYAAVALAANAGLISGTVRGGGLPLPGAMLQATPATSGLQGKTTSDAHGRYQLFLGAGYYDLAASAFGYAPASAHALAVVTGTTTVQDFDLTPLPTGRVRGTVRAAGGGALEATVRVLGTPVAATTAGGSYDLALPGGSYTLQVRALGYRVVTASVTVTAGQTAYHDFLLPATMRLLLLDSGPWYYQSQVAYYRQALDELSYAYDERRLKHLPGDLPTLTELLSYDLLIWSAPADSPALVGAGGVISDYLGSGGSLLLSGQDVGYWDGGGDWSLQPYYVNYLHSIFQADDAPSRRVVCLEGGAFDGITLTIEGAGGADNQRWPDELAVYHPDHASVACSYEGGQAAVIQAGFCDAHRALNLGFGFEAINEAADRAAFMARALDWFASPRQAAGVELLRQTDPTQVAPPGGVVTHTWRLRNLGEAGAGDRVHIEVSPSTGSGQDWPSSVLTPTVDLAPCATTTVGLRVEIPPGANWDAFDAVTLTARSSVSPALRQTLLLTSKVPAPVLLVDDERWYNQEGAYEEALRANGLPYDRWEVDPREIFGRGSPPAEVLAWYPLVLWFNGYDWFDPIHPSELERLTGYLDGGGRLFLSSQDALYYIWPSALARDYLGVMDYSEGLSQTVAQGVPGHVLGEGLGPVDLAYPFKNWSDSVLPTPGTAVAFRGQRGQPGALTREGVCDRPSPGCRWRSAFFAFPFETLPAETRATLMARLVGWLSWLGGSNLQADRAVARVGDTLGYTLTLRNDGPGAVASASVSNTLPAGTALVTGPAGGASYDPAGRRVTWSGGLAPGAAVTFTYRLRLVDGAEHSALRNTADISLVEQGLHFQRQASVRVAAPNLSPSRLSMTPAVARASTGVSVTLVLRNEGLDDARNVSVDNPLPWPLRLVTGTLSSGGVGLAEELLGENRVRWEGVLAVGERVTLTYGAVAPPVLEAATWVYNAARLEDGLGGAWERGGWLYVEPQRLYFPLFFKDATP